MGARPRDAELFFSSIFAPCIHTSLLLQYRFTHPKWEKLLRHVFDPTTGRLKLRDFYGEPSSCWSPGDADVHTKQMLIQQILVWIKRTPSKPGTSISLSTVATYNLQFLHLPAQSRSAVGTFLPRKLDLNAQAKVSAELLLTSLLVQVMNISSTCRTQ